MEVYTIQYRKGKWTKGDCWSSDRVESKYLYRVKRKSAFEHAKNTHIRISSFIHSLPANDSVYRQ